MKALLLASMLVFGATAAHADYLSNAEALVDGIYRVPVANPEHEKFASFPIKLLASEMIADTETLHYTLPKELVGRDLPIALNRRTDGRYRGDHARGNCDSATNLLSCEIEYRDLDVDLAQVRAHIFSRFTDPAEAQIRFDIAVGFVDEPKGFVTYGR